MGSEAALEEELDLEPRVGDALEKEIESYCCLFVCFQVLLQKINIFFGSLFSVSTINLLGPGRTGKLIAILALL